VVADLVIVEHAPHAPLDLDVLAALVAIQLDPAPWWWWRRWPSGRRRSRPWRCWSPSRWWPR
jgi:hypothetical protein